MYVELGKVVGVWGVKGWIKLHSYTRERVGIAKYKTWYLQDSRKNTEPSEINVIHCREQAQGIVAQIDGVVDRDQAMALNGQKILVKESDLPELSSGEFYWQQLIGLEVINSVDKIGVIASILETGANDVLVVKPASSDQAASDQIDVLIPYTDQTVLEVNIEQGTMLVDWDPDFLLD